MNKLSNGNAIILADPSKVEIERDGGKGLAFVFRKCSNETSGVTCASPAEIDAWL